MADSLVVRQFMELARGAKVSRVRLVDSPVVKIEPVENRLCQRCQTVGIQDVIRFANKMHWEVCRVCRSVHENSVLTDFVLDGGTVERYAI